MAECPKVEMLLESTNRWVDVIREGFDMAIRVRFPPLEDSDLVVRKLAGRGQRLLASPSLLPSPGELAPADLATLLFPATRNIGNRPINMPYRKSVRCPFHLTFDSTIV
jgi:DNA-binding transcriptional LysR family regulator